MSKIKQDKVVEITSQCIESFSEPLIENPKNVHEITKEKMNKIKEKNKKTQIATIYAKEPIQLTPLSPEEAEIIKKIKEKNKKKPAPIKTKSINSEITL